MTTTTDTVTLHLPDVGVQIATWLSYSFNSDFLTPSDAWHFTLSPVATTKEAMAVLEAGARVTFTVNGHTEGTGYIDEILCHHDRESGTIITVEGSDLLGPMVDSNMDPRARFSDTASLHDFVLAVAAPFGWYTDESIVADDAANQRVLTGETRGIRTTKKGKPLKQVMLHRLKPYPHEGTFAFMSRITQRHGLWVWCSADGQTLIVGKPDFDQGPLYALTRRLDGQGNNIVTGGARYSLKNQPSVIVAQGFGGGGEFPKARMTCIQENAAVIADNTAILDTYPDAIPAAPFEAARLNARRIKSRVARPMFLHDDESKTPEELQNFVKREMALRMRQSFRYECTVDGHTQDGVPWAVNTMVKVDDERADVHELLWVLSRTFMKDRSGGTRTHLELVRPGTLEF